MRQVNENVVAMVFWLLSVVAVFGVLTAWEAVKLYMGW